MSRFCPASIASWVAILAMLACVDGKSLAAAEPAGTSTVDFVRDVQPIFRKHCYACHAGNHREGGLRLDVRAAALAGGDSGQKAIVPSDPKASRLLGAISGTDPDLRMPPEGKGEPPSAEAIELIARWISQGASWPAEADAARERADHWAWHPPGKAALPAVRNATWPRHPLDYFVLAALEAKQLSPAFDADRHTLVRRVYLDLVGLPPTLAEVEAFASDTRSDAYERMVDRALAHPGYGERWARVWLDLARYADSKGYGSDPLRSIWRYRDWVIEAFNRNLPYDQFTIEQLAGDLLPRPKADQILATAFHRNTMANDEGGTDDEEFRVAAVKDRIETTMQVWMGLTMGCAKCHSHKFDPITQREYYQAYAVFNQTEDADRGDEEPRALTPSRAQEFELAASRAREAAFRAKVDAAVLDPDLMPLATGILRVELAALETSTKRLEAAQAKTPIMRELPPQSRRATHIMTKGNFRAPGEVVEPGLPAAFHALPAGCAPDRLGLAHWLVDRENPLTARVMVNRLWAQLFGTGIVSTEEDFGTQGARPTHPDVLDWLAVEFMDGGWDIKDILRQIVTSATYRQASSPSASLLEIDPHNRLLARGPRARLEAEMVRDQALAIAGLLSDKQGGPSVYPPQPPGLWRAAFNGERTWSTSSGADRYRRGLYTYWRRTVPYPSMAVFDAPSREICALRRISTNTPLQAFVTLNDPVYVEAAQALARRIVAEGGASLEDRAAFALRLALARPAEKPQIEQLASLYRDARASYDQDPQSAELIVSDPLGPLPSGWDARELAAWTVVANVVLNLDGLLTKR
jgi:hypothetical protein